MIRNTNSLIPSYQLKTKLKVLDGSRLHYAVHTYIIDFKTKPLSVVIHLYDSVEYHFNLVPSKYLKTYTQRSFKKFTVTLLSAPWLVGANPALI